MATPLTTDHVATDEVERERVVAAGGFITDDAKFGLRVNGLQVTRSLGDVGSPGTVATPSTTRIPLGKGNVLGVDVPPNAVSLVQYVVLASDGVWGGISVQALLDEIIQPEMRAAAAGEAILNAAEERADPNALDNLSVAVYCRVTKPV